MTHRELERLVRRWQRRLALERWRLEVVIDAKRWDDLGYEGDSPPAASVRFRVKYHEAEVFLNPTTCRTWSPLDAATTIVHELVHLVVRPLEVVSNDLEQLVNRDAWTMFEGAHDRALELVVDELAKRFVELDVELTPAPARRRRRRTHVSSGARRGRS